MACLECQKRREKLIDAALEGRLATAAGHLIKGAAEMVGLKPKTATTEGGPVEPVADIEADPPIKKTRASRS